MKRHLIFIFLFFIAVKGYTQLKLENIPYILSEINNKDAKGKQGIWFNYDKINHIIYSMQNYNNDTLNGYFENYWYNNGNISEKGYYKNGKLDSIFIAYWEDGQIRGISNYKNGVFNGIVSSYNKDEKLILRRNYILGNIDPNYNDFYVDTTLVFDNKIKVDYTSKTINKIDTVITKYDTKWNKESDIYINDTLCKHIDYYKNKVKIETIYQNSEDYKRIIYSRNKPYYIEKILYFQKNKLIKKEEFDKNGKLK